MFKLAPIQLSIVRTLQDAKCALSAPQIRKRIKYVAADQPEAFKAIVDGLAKLGFIERRERKRFTSTL